MKYVNVFTEYLNSYKGVRSLTLSNEGEHMIAGEKTKVKGKDLAYDLLAKDLNNLVTFIFEEKGYDVIHISCVPSFPNNKSLDITITSTKVDVTIIKFHYDHDKVTEDNSKDLIESIKNLPHLKVFEELVINLQEVKYKTHAVKEAAWKYLTNTEQAIDELVNKVNELIEACPPSHVIDCVVNALTEPLPNTPGNYDYEGKDIPEPLKALIDFYNGKGDPVTFGFHDTAELSSIVSTLLSMLAGLKMCTGEAILN